MHVTRTTAILACAAVALAAAAGCGGVKTYPVKGTVRFEGKSMKGGGSISFVPTTKQDGKAAGGEIAEDGTYTLTTNTPGDGSMAGEFRVVISQVTEREPEATRDGERTGKSVVLVGKDERIPLVYSDAYKSPLTAKVEAKDNVIDFDLKRNPGGGDVPWGAMRDGRRADDVARLDPFGFLGRAGDNLR
jgi:hypothetical protein